MAREALLFLPALRDNFGYLINSCHMKTGLSNLGAPKLNTNCKNARICIRVLLAFVFALCCPHFAAAADTAGASASQGLPFAVADFDGDHQPDLASVQTGATGTSSGNYLVRFRFSALGKRYVRVTAPKGGLLVEARDVNGDQLPDLVVASAWLDKPVAILLNDGNGNFLQVDPANYPDALGAPGPGWNSSRTNYFLAFGLTQKSSLSDISLANCAQAPDSSHAGLNTRRVRLALSLVLSLSAPRAPPLAILL